MDRIRELAETYVSFSEWAYLGLGAWSLVMVAILPDQRLPYLLAVWFVLGLAVNPRSLRVLADMRLWALCLLALAMGALWLGERDAVTLGLAWSRAGLRQGLAMGVRALALILGLSVAVGGMSISAWARLFASWGLPGLGFALGVAFNLLPTLGDLSEAAYHSIRLRGGLRRPLVAARLFLITVTANALRYGDEVVKAASSRAFDPASYPRRAIPFRLPDGVLLGILGLSTVGLLWGA